MHATLVHGFLIRISIHALHEESDSRTIGLVSLFRNFNPRSP